MIPNLKEMELLVNQDYERILSWRVLRRDPSVAFVDLVLIIGKMNFNSN